jgi:protease-4
MTADSTNLLAGDAPQQGGASNSPPFVLRPPTALGRYGKLLLLALAIAVAVIVGQAASYRSYFSPPGGPQERFHSLSETAKSKIAIISLEGIILDGEFVKRQIDRVQDDDSVVAVVLRVDSPGGTVTGSDYLYHHLGELIRDRKIPVVVSMGSMCASGGYYVAMAVVGDGASDADDPLIFAEPTTWTGSIGVVIPHYDLSGLLAEFNVRDDSIVSHPNKLMGSPTRELSPEARARERELLQTLVNQSFDRFKEIVKSGRPKLQDDDEALKEATTGQIFTAQQALDLGLIDKIGFIEDAIERAVELTGRESSQLRCVEYDAPPTSLSMLIGSGTTRLPRSHGLDLGALLDLTAPRAYYLCTWLPAMLSNSR